MEILLFLSLEHYCTFRVLEVLVEEKFYVMREKVLFHVILFCLLEIRTNLNTFVECTTVQRHLSKIILIYLMANA